MPPSWWSFPVALSEPLHHPNICILKMAEAFARSPFLGFSSHSLPQAQNIRDVAERLAEAGVHCQSWEKLGRGGRLILETILGAITASDLAVFELTDLNTNVLFELGHAIGSGKPVWILRDDTIREAEEGWHAFGLLSTTKYSPSTNVQAIYDAFFTDAPVPGQGTLLEDLRQGITEFQPHQLMYLGLQNPTEADRRLVRMFDEYSKQGISSRFVDPTESSYESLQWYLEQGLASRAIVVHLSAPNRVNATIHNARYSFLAGVFVGLGLTTVMIAEESYDPGLDYRDILFRYRTPRQVSERVEQWLKAPIAALVERGLVLRERVSASRLATELRQLRLGQHVAEYEADDLDTYFVETVVSRQVAEPGVGIFIGRKGTGKTATLLHAAEELRADKRNLVVVVKPPSYEFQALRQLLDRYVTADREHYLIEAIWQFLLTSEVAGAEYRRIMAQPSSPSPDTAQGRLVAFLDDNPELLQEFGLRLEKAVAAVTEITGRAPDPSISVSRGALTSALHGVFVDRLRELLQFCLRSRPVFILVDNLDKGWERDRDVGRMGLFLLGLLSAAQRLRESLGGGKQQVEVNLAVFVRSDIWRRVSEVAREPDKLPLTRVEWDSREALLRVVEDRYAAQAPYDTDGREFWSRYFAEGCTGQKEVTEYILERIQPRPRDIIYFCAAAITSAIARRAPRITLQDLERAYSQYSQFAFEAMQVENSVTLAELERVLYEFVGTAAELPVAEVVRLVAAAGVEGDQLQAVILHLVDLAFLGVQLDGKYLYSVLSSDERKVRVLAEQSLLGARDLRLVIHPAFRAFLETAP
jgi:hypothetical protein